MKAMNDTALSDYVTFTTADQIFGLPIECVQDVFKPSRITRVPLAGPEIAGVLNLRGRIVTAIELLSRDLNAEIRVALQSLLRRIGETRLGVAPPVMDTISPRSSVSQRVSRSGSQATM